jgi:hypothetical protein
VFEALGQCAARDVLHHDVDQIVVLAVVDDGQDIRMVQLGDGFSFADEALAELGRAGLLRQQHLDGHKAIERGLARFEDRGHAAMPDGFDDVILAQRLADEVHADRIALRRLWSVFDVGSKHTIFCGEKPIGAERSHSAPVEHLVDGALPLEADYRGK